MKVAKFKKLLSIALPEDLYLTIKSITDEREISMSQWFREAADNFLNEKEDLTDDRKSDNQ